MIDRETAVESLSHQIASCVHLMLANRHVTVAGLKEMLTALPTREPLDNVSVIDYLLAAKNPHTIQSSLLADIAYVLGFDWDFKISKIADHVPESPPRIGGENDRPIHHRRRPEVL